MRPVHATLAALVLVCVACTPNGFAQMSAEPTSCPADHIEISDASQPMEGPSSWTATCLGDDGSVVKKWFCSKAHDEVICADYPSA